MRETGAPDEVAIGIATGWDAAGMRDAANAWAARYDGRYKPAPFAALAEEHPAEEHPGEAGINSDTGDVPPVPAARRPAPATPVQEPYQPVRGEDGSLFVPSASRPGCFYRATPESCSCESWRYGAARDPAFKCKHQLAAGW